MKKIVASILHIISLLFIIASVMNFLLIIIISGYGYGGDVLGEYLIILEVIFVIISYTTYFIGKYLKKIN